MCILKRVSSVLHTSVGTDNQVLEICASNYRSINYVSVYKILYAIGSQIFRFAVHEYHQGEMVSSTI